MENLTINIDNEIREIVERITGLQINLSEKLWKKQDIVKEYNLKRIYNCKELSEELGVNKNSISKWHNQRLSKYKHGKSKFKISDKDIADIKAMTGKHAYEVREKNIINN